MQKLSASAKREAKWRPHWDSRFSFIPLYCFRSRIPSKPDCFHYGIFEKFYNWLPLAMYFPFSNSMDLSRKHTAADSHVFSIVKAQQRRSSNNRSRNSLWCNTSSPSSTEHPHIFDIALKGTSKTRQEVHMYSCKGHTKLYQTYNFKTNHPVIWYLGINKQ